MLGVGGVEEGGLLEEDRGRRALYLSSIERRSRPIRSERFVEERLQCDDEVDSDEESG